MISRIRIVHLITGLNAGGAEMALSHLLEAMDRREFDSSVVTLIKPGPVGELITAQGIPIFSLDMTPGHATLAGFMRLNRILRDFRPHILQTWMYHADFLGLIAGKLAGVPVIAWNLRGSERNFANSKGLSKIVIKTCAILSGWPQAVLVNSRAGQEAHKKLGYHPRRWQFIPNGIDTVQFSPDPVSGKKVRDELNITDAADVIGMVARLDPQKGHLDFLQAAAIVIKEKPDALFICVGGGSQNFADELKSQAESMGLGSSIHWTGTRLDMPAMYNAFNICVSASAYGEGFPNVVAEAMACGIPCIVTKTGDSAELIADTGMIVRPRDPQAIANAILQLLNTSAEGRKLLGTNARQRIVSNFSLEKMTQEYAQFYLQLT